MSSISDRLVCMDIGGITAAGDPEAVLTDPGVVLSYVGESPETIARSGSLAGQESRGRVQRRAGAWSSGRRLRA
jgi:hypothetical protein